MDTRIGWIARRVCLLALAASVAHSALAGPGRQSAKSLARDANETAKRADIRPLPDALKARLVELAGRPHTFLPLTVFSEAPTPSQLFAYYLLDTGGFEPNVFTSIFPGINDGVAGTAANCANHGLNTIGGVRLVVEPKPGLPTDPNDPGAFIDVFTDVSGLFVINNESGWYEGWMIHDLVVPPVAPTRADGVHAEFGQMTSGDAVVIAAIGAGNDVPGNRFTVDGQPPRSPSPIDHFPDSQSNLVPIFLSMGAWNAVQQSDAHSYWEFNQYTDWAFPAYELPATGGGLIGSSDVVTGCVSLVPGPGPAGASNDPAVFGDTPANPRDPDRLLNTSPEDADCPMVNNDDRKETRLRFVPSGLANEVLLDVYVRRASFEPAVTDLQQRLFDAYAAEVARVDQNGDGIVDAVEGDLEEESDELSNDRLYLPAPTFDRFAVTREINDGLLAPRFAPTQRAWVLSGSLSRVDPAVPASILQDEDNR
jgi:hypothetical protein